MLLAKYNGDDQKGDGDEALTPGSTKEVRNGSAHASNGDTDGVESHDEGKRTGRSDGKKRDGTDVSKTEAHEKNKAEVQTKSESENGVSFQQSVHRCIARVHLAGGR